MANALCMDRVSDGNGAPGNQTESYYPACPKDNDMKPIKNKITAPAMTREEWEALPPAVRYFIPWQKARKPLTVKTVKPPAKMRNPDGYKYFAEGRQ